MLKQIDRHILRVPSVEPAVRYYRDVLGLTLQKHEKNVASFRLACGTELVLHSDPDLPAEGIYYLVDDVRELYRRRKELQLNFVNSPQQVSRGFRATVKDPFGNILSLLDRTSDAREDAGGAKTTTIENAKPAGALFAGIEPVTSPKKDVLIELYESVGRTADDLPYTPHFEKLYAGYIAQHEGEKPTKQDVWRHLLNLRKAGKLKKLGDARSKAPAVTEESRTLLREMLGTDIGRRDRLPYTKRFETLVDDFNRSQLRKLSPHLVWRLVATIAK